MNIITTAQELQNLPSGTVITEVGRPHVARLVATDDFRTWFYTGSDREFYDEEVHLPVRVIYDPKEAPDAS